MRLAVILGSLEIAIVTVLSLFSVASPGPGGAKVHPFNPTASISANGFFLAVVFTIFAFGGFESVAPLAEETDNPRRVLPRAIMISIVIAGVFYVFTGWAFITGWGPNNADSFAASAENRVFVIARHHWGGAWIIAFLALVNSIFAIGLAASNAATRVLFAMSRAGALPAFLSKLHPTRRTPVNAIYFQGALSIAFGLAVGFWLGPAVLFFTVGLATTLALMLIYIAGNVGVFRFYRRHHRPEFSVVKHLLFPLVSSLALIVVGYESLNPLPASPTYWGAVATAVWLVIGALILLAMRQRGKETWLLQAANVYEEPAGGA